jgi:hypothetical protein
MTFFDSARALSIGGTGLAQQWTVLMRVAVLVRASLGGMSEKRNRLSKRYRWQTPSRVVSRWQKQTVDLDAKAK